jgi:hypothetical protein
VLDLIDGKRVETLVVDFPLEVWVLLQPPECSPIDVVLLCELLLRSGKAVCAASIVMLARRVSPSRAIAPAAIASSVPPRQ